MARLLVKAGSLFQGTDATSVINEVSILIVDGEIQAIYPKGEMKETSVDREIDARNHFVMPGMVDLHVHLTASGEANYISRMLESVEYSVLQAQHNATKTLEAGFTTVRDVGSKNYGVIALKNAIKNGITRGPRILAAGKALTETGGHGDTPYFFQNIPYSNGRVCDGVDEVRKAVREQIKMGADLIKIHSSGGHGSPQDDPNQPQFTLEEISNIVSEAHSKNRRVAAHAQSRIGIRNALEGGVDSIEHASDLDEELCRIIKERERIIVPTLIPGMMAVQHGVKSGISEWSVKKSEASLERARRSVKLAYQNNVKIGFGTDAGTPFNFHGINALEFRLLVEHAGMQTSDAIYSATGLAAEALGLEGVLGSISQGKVADIVIVKGNPIDNISCLEDVGNIKMVIKDGLIEKNTDARL